MKCEKCGNEYPSQYFFVTHNLCKNCFEKMSPEEQQKIMDELYSNYPQVNYYNRVGFGRRLGAALIDYMILVIITMAVFSFTGFFSALQKFLMDAQGLQNNPVEMLQLEQQFMAENMNSIIFNSIITIAYYSLEMLIGATLGKLILGIQIARADGHKADFFTLFKRFITKNSSNILSFIAIITTISAFNIISVVCMITIFVGFFVTLSDKKQALHDLVAKTAVFKKHDIVDAANSSNE